MEVSDAKHLKALEQENIRLKRLLADTLLDKETLDIVLKKVLIRVQKRQAVSEMLKHSAISELEPVS